MQMVSQVNGGIHSLSSGAFYGHQQSSYLPQVGASAASLHNSFMQVSVVLLLCGRQRFTHAANMVPVKSYDFSRPLVEKELYD